MNKSNLTHGGIVRIVCLVVHSLVLALLLAATWNWLAVDMLGAQKVTYAVGIGLATVWHIGRMLFGQQPHNYMLDWDFATELLCLMALYALITIAQSGPINLLNFTP